eukprot:TRINITY_DN43342_c0_g1_i1.p1 TRINITY_DN43342_c0_g1~~TRINITY_DN43342_c0_g1_i1.p1  ORF type:complete len:766 (-),score=166.86 TRINITY_DN43342_c0_g1_i1:126-2303(-)
MKTRVPNRPASRESTSRPNTPMVSRPNTPGLSAMSDSLDFFRHGFSGIGEDILQEVRRELSLTSSSIRDEVSSALHANTQLFGGKLKELASSLDRVAGPVAGQNGQIQDIASDLSKVTRQLEEVQKKSDMDDMVLRIMQRIDVSGVFDVKMVGIFQRLKEYQLESKATTSELQKDLEGIQSLLRATKEAAQEVTQIPESFQKLMHEAKSSRGAINTKCNHIMVEIGRIQQHLQLDYAKGRRSSGASHDEHQEDDGIRRVREVWCQTDGATCDEWVQTDPAMSKERKQKRAKTEVVDKARTAAFDADALKDRIRQTMAVPQYNVHDCYKEEGIFQAIARSSIFDNLTLFMVALNSIWIAIDIDLNTAATITNADAIYQVMDHLFCTYFFCEIVIRFCAFEKKRDAFVDRWFVFDSILVTNMVVETWILPLIFLAMAEEASQNQVTDLTMLRMLRMVKLLRLTRISRFLRSVPELVIIVKAIGLAARSVVIFFLLWLIVIYVFAVVLRQITDGTPVGNKWFRSVPSSMNTLLLDGILADYGGVIRELGDVNPGYWMVMISFVLLASITIMYMLVGVLVEVVGVISATEKEGMLISFLSDSVREKLILRGHNPDSNLTKYELQNFLLESDVCMLLGSLDINVEAIMDMLEMTFDDLDKKGRDMTFVKLIDMLLDGREGNAATVKDKTDLLRVLKSQVRNSASELEEKMETNFLMLKEGLDEIRDDTLT